MNTKSAIILPALCAVTLIAGCSSGNDSPSAETPDNQNPPTGNTGPFFNDTDGAAFAGSLGGSLSRLFSAVIGGTGLAGNNASNSMFSGTTPRAVNTTVQQCESGNSTLTTTTDDTTMAVTNIAFSFGDCVNSGLTSSGTVSISFTNGTDLDNATIDVNFADFSTTEGTSVSSISGSVSSSTSTVGDTTTTTLSGTTLTMVEGTETTTFSNYSLTSIDNDTTGAQSLNTTMTVTSSVDGTITIGTDTPLVVPDDSTEYPTLGTLSMTHSDGSSIILNADTGNAATYTYSITSNGSTTTGGGNWAEFELILPNT